MKFIAREGVSHIQTESSARLEEFLTEEEAAAGGPVAVQTGCGLKSIVDFESIGFSSLEPRGREVGIFVVMAISEIHLWLEND